MWLCMVFFLPLAKRYMREREIRMNAGGLYVSSFFFCLYTRAGRKKSRKKAASRPLCKPYKPYRETEGSKVFYTFKSNIQHRENTVKKKTSNIQKNIYPHNYNNNNNNKLRSIRPTTIIIYIYLTVSRFCDYTCIVRDFYRRQFIIMYTSLLERYIAFVYLIILYKKFVNFMLFEFTRIYHLIPMY